MSKRKHKQTPKSGSSKKPNTNQDTPVLPVSEFVRDFVRRHVAPSQRAQSDLSWTPGASNVSYNLNLMPQSTRRTNRLLNQPKRHTSNLAIRFKHSRQHSVTPISCPKPYVIPSNLSAQLHNLWIGYANSSIGWSRLVGMASFQPVANASQTSQMESILRLNLIGARLRIIRCTGSCLVGKQGIVVMETKTLFRMALDEDKQQVDSKSSSITLRNIPKAGSLFLLVPPRCLGDKQLWNPTEFGILLNGDRLVQRVVDRATRKWRAPMPTIGRNVLSVDELMSDLLCEQCC